MLAQMGPQGWANLSVPTPAQAPAASVGDMALGGKGPARDMSLAGKNSGLPMASPIARLPGPVATARVTPPPQPAAAPQQPAAPAAREPTLADFWASFNYGSSAL